jgi:hypothetical protein
VRKKSWFNWIDIDWIHLSLSENTGICPFEFNDWSWRSLWRYSLTLNVSDNLANDATISRCDISPLEDKRIEVECFWPQHGHLHALNSIQKCTAERKMQFKISRNGRTWKGTSSHPYHNPICSRRATGMLPNMIHKCAHVPFHEAGKTVWQKANIARG